MNEDKVGEYWYDGVKMEFISDPELFRQKLIAVDALIRPENHLPKQVFKEQFSKFAVIDFDEIFIDFFERLNRWLNATGEELWNFVVISPDPELYFFHHFRIYPAFEVGATDLLRDYQSLISKDPGGSPADAIETNAQVIVIFPNSRSWAIYADRDFEIGIIGFKDGSTKNLFEQAYGRDRLLSVSRGVSHFLPVIFPDNRVPDGIRVELLNNYGTTS